MGDRITFSSEADLCTAFMDMMKSCGWTCYPEQGGWDVLCVRRRVQIGVQAKLIANQHVMMQALTDIPATVFHNRRPKNKSGPTYRSVLVGDYRGRTDTIKSQTRSAFGQLARHLRLLVFDAHDGNIKIAEDQVLGYWSYARKYNVRVVWRHYRWCSGNVWVPPFVPTHAAGVPSPQTVSPWMIAAVDMERLCRSRGWVTRSDAVASAKGWNPGSMLNAFFHCTADRDEVGQRKWVLKGTVYVGRTGDTVALEPQHPSVRYPQVAEAYK